MIGEILGADQTAVNSVWAKFLQFLEKFGMIGVVVLALVGSLIYKTYDPANLPVWVGLIGFTSLYPVITDTIVLKKSLAALQAHFSEVAVHNTKIFGVIISRIEEVIASQSGKFSLTTLLYVLPQFSDSLKWSIARAILSYADVGGMNTEIESRVIDSLAPIISSQCQDFSTRTNLLNSEQMCSKYMQAVRFIIDELRTLHGEQKYGRDLHRLISMKMMDATSDLLKIAENAPQPPDIILGSTGAEGGK